MKLTLKTDYSLRVLIYLLKSDKATIAEIAKHYGIKKNHLSIVVQKLAELKFINSTTGPKGGISLNPLALEKTVADVVLEFEELDLVECFNEKTNTCHLSPRCHLKKILRKATHSFLEELKDHKIKDLS